MNAATTRWLSWPGICLALFVLCSPYLLVDIPPQVDVPGHIGAAAIEAAGPQSPLAQFYSWQWSFNLNLGGELLMKLLGSGIGAAWWTNLIATAALLSGAMLTFRALNRDGNYALGWTLVWAFGFPWIWGFTNFILAAGISLIAFGTASALDQKPSMRSAVLLIAQPIALSCHAVGGLILPVLLVASATGSLIDDRMASSRSIRQIFAGTILPLAATPLVIALWQVTREASGVVDLHWDWGGKADFLIEVLRDQNYLLDVATAVASYVVILFGPLAGARWTWRQGLPALAVFLLYAFMPAGINGSEAVDTRLLPVAILLALGLQDWSRANIVVARTVAVSGALIVMVRMIVIGASFAVYSSEFERQLQVLDRIPQGSRVAAVTRHGCIEDEWRMSRLDMLPALATATRKAWVNVNWTVPGLHMARSRIHPADGHEIPQFVWDPSCAQHAGSNLATALPKLPRANLDYVWLLDTGPPPTDFTPGKLVWHWQRSYLYQTADGASDR